jgi:DNA-binding IclR family transcriptional regulator
LLDGLHRCVGAISVTNIAHRMTPEHRQEVLTTLRDELAAIKSRLRLLKADSSNNVRG